MPPPPLPQPLPEEVVELLHRYSFDAERFEALRDRWRAAGGDPRVLNQLHGEPTPPVPSDIRTLPCRGSQEAETSRRRALQAISAGEVAVIVLAGGMATRFGGAVKALVEVLPGQTFLDVKRADAERAATEAGGHVPFLLMTSFATEKPIAAHLLASESRWPRSPAATFPQFLSLRLDESGALFRFEDGRPSPYATGHGDLPFALRARRSPGALPDSVEYLFVSNVDNLGATCDPLVLGAHLQALDTGAEVSVEVVSKEPGDQGGVPLWLDGVLQVVESFRLPPAFDSERVRVFNTNTFLFRRRSLERLPESALDWFAVPKRVGARTAVQFERLLGQSTATLRAHFLHVPREGGHTRFLPIKTRAELSLRRNRISRMWSECAPQDRG